jgi:hypothetical protein
MWCVSLTHAPAKQTNPKQDEEVDFYEFLTACKKSDILGHMALGGYLL